MNYNNDKHEDIETDLYSENDDIEFIKLDLDDDIDNKLEITESDYIDNKYRNSNDVDLNRIQENDNIFEQPIKLEDENENVIRKQKLKKYNYTFKSNNSSIEDLEKIPAYKRMGIEIDNSKPQSQDIYSKTILNDENKLEFPDVNTYLNDNVD